MTSEEFSAWLDYHGSLNPGFSVWYGKQADEMIVVWSEGLGDVDLDSAKQASKEIAIGDIDEPRGFTKHLPAVRSRARELAFAKDETPRKRWTAGHESFSCAYCWDSGFVTIYHPVTVDLAMRGELDEATMIRTCAVDCCCDAGKRDSDTKFTPLAEYQCRRYRSRLMASQIVRVCMIQARPLTQEDQRQELFAGVDDYNDRNRVKAFDEFNSAG